MKENIHWIARLRTTTTIAVILLHVASKILYKYGQVSTEIWLTGNFYDSGVRFCVPIFFMLSGALLLDKDYELSVI
ncbi:acyltransferase family protein [Lacinutrix sp. WUR7]|nr:acyltransferase family protein [Lacinutrix sp. WUR7]